jgi:hypothetical protein
MSAAVRYYLHAVALRQSFLGPVAVYLALLAVLFSNDAGSAISAATLTAAALMPICAWLMRIVVGSESAPFADMTRIALGGAFRPGIARCGSVLIVAAGLTGASLVWGIIANPHPYPAATVGVLIAMHLAQAIAGIGIGSVAAPLPAGWSLLALGILVVASTASRFIPPIGPMMWTLGSSSASPSWPVVALVIAQAALTGLLAGAIALARRR